MHVTRAPVCACCAVRRSGRTATSGRSPAQSVPTCDFTVSLLNEEWSGGRRGTRSPGRRWTCAIGDGTPECDAGKFRTYKYRRRQISRRTMVTSC